MASVGNKQLRNQRPLICRVGGAPDLQKKPLAHRPKDPRQHRGPIGKRARLKTLYGAMVGVEKTMCLRPRYGTLWGIKGQASRHARLQACSEVRAARGGGRCYGSPGAGRPGKPVLGITLQKVGAGEMATVHGANSVRQKATGAGASVHRGRAKSVPEGALSGRRVR